MQVTYNRKEDILVLELSSGVIGRAEEAGPLIAHFSVDGKLVLLEILDASEFLLNSLTGQYEFWGVIGSSPSRFSLAYLEG